MRSSSRGNDDGFVKSPDARAVIRVADQVVSSGRRLMRPFTERPGFQIRAPRRRRGSFHTMTNIRTILQQAARDLNVSGSPSPRLDAEVLLMRFLEDRPFAALHASGTGTFGGGGRRVCARVERRSLGEPVAYILGEKEFWSLRFEVGREVLIPRPETECLIEELLRFYRPPGEGLRILDIGTGSGAIGVVLARELPAARVAATDISPGALSVARRNALAHGVADRMDFFQGDLLAAVSGNFDIICSNPPYIPEVQYDLLPAGIRDFEPRGGAHRRSGRLGLSPADHPGRGASPEGGRPDLPGDRRGAEGSGRGPLPGGGRLRDIDCRKDYGGTACASSTCALARSRTVRKSNARFRDHDSPLDEA